MEIDEKRRSRRGSRRGSSNKKFQTDKAGRRQATFGGDVDEERDAASNIDIVDGDGPFEGAIRTNIKAVDYSTGTPLKYDMRSDA